MSMTRKISTLVAAVALVGAVSACSVFAGRESSGQYVDDSTITSKAKAKIVADEILKGFEIHVETFQGTVQLSGFVDSVNSKSHAEDIVSHIEGVRSVQDNLIIR